MPVEILAYSPNNLKDFIDFCIKGKPKGSDDLEKFETDELGREIRGVMSWLHGGRVRRAQFWHTPLDDDHPMPFFMALVERDDVDPVRPWFGTVLTSPPKIILDPDIPGIDKQLRVDGQLGILQDFVPISELLGAITHDTDLDKEFDRQRERVLVVLRQLESDMRRMFFAALRGDKGSTKVFEKLKFSLH